MTEPATEEVIRWLLSLYQAAQESSLSELKHEVFNKLKAFIPLSSAVWVSTTSAPDGGFSFLGLHPFNEPDDLADELPGTNQKYQDGMRWALAHPGKAHSCYPYGDYRGTAHAQMREYICRFGHHNSLMIVDTAPRKGRREWLSLYRSRPDHHFTPAEERILSVLMPHIMEALAISREVSGLAAAEAESSLAGRRALVQANGLMITCGERFKHVIQKCWPDWCSLRLPAELMKNLSPGVRHLPAADGTITIKTEKLGPYLFLQARHRGRDTLSEREAQLAHLFATGMTYREIADTTVLRPATVRNVLQKVYCKLQVGSKPALVLALRSGKDADGGESPASMPGRMTSDPAAGPAAPQAPAGEDS
jgi:DNA-binding CsgD family transcriptional regulator